jgi:curli production assembly/transport component CsgF|tara:strand:- start:59 stop:598 length:540 start_codon:yes stop_codon:yes gene_type:complete
MAKVKKKRGRPSKKELKIAQENIEKRGIAIAMAIIAVFLFIGILTVNLQADQITFKFKSPSFSGVNTSSHYLTIENQEHMRKMTIKEEIKALQEQLERDAENTTLARFIRNLESRIYAQISRQIVEAMFGEEQSTEGTFELEGNIISYKIENGMIILTIFNTNDGTTTEISLPLGDFSF